nr:hypothetical protein [Tanacetum cinerariifolium]
MAEEQDEQQQQNMLDVALVLNNEQVNIVVCNFRIALEKIQLYVIDQRMITSSNVDFAELIEGEFKYQIESRKGTKDPIFGMSIPAIMLNDEIKASVGYLEYLEKTKGSTPIKATGKVSEEVAQSDEVVADDSEAEKTDEEPLVRKRLSGIVIVGEAHRESKEKEADHSMNMKGLETLSKAAHAPDELNLISSNKRAGVTPEVPDEPNNDFSSSGSDSKFVVKDISSDEDEVTKKVDDVKKSYVEKVTDEKVTKAQVAEKQTRDEKHEFTNQFLNKKAKVNLSDILKDSVEPTVQSMVDVPVKQAKLAALRPPLVDTTMTLIPDITREQEWSPELEKTTKALEEFDDLLGFTFDFLNFIRYHLEKDKHTKADLEGPVSGLFKRTYKSSIELGYHLEQRCLAFFDKLDWTNHEGDKIP